MSIFFAACPCGAVGGPSDSRVRDPVLEIRPGHLLSFLLSLIQDGQLLFVYLVLVNRSGGLKVGRKSLPKNILVKVTDRPDMTTAGYRGLKAIKQRQRQQQPIFPLIFTGR